MPIRFVVFNGPARAGKSTSTQMLVTLLRNKGYRANSDSFASPMKHFAATLFAKEYHKLAKDEMVAELGGSSPRQMLIAMSEEFLKPHYGEDFLGRMLYYRALRSTPPPDWVIVDDSGFRAEFEALGEPNCRYIVQLRRPGTNFRGDSRNFLADPDWYINNDGDLDMLRSSVYA